MAVDVEDAERVQPEDARSEFPVIERHGLGTVQRSAIRSAARGVPLHKRFAVGTGV